MMKPLAAELEKNEPPTRSSSFGDMTGTYATGPLGETRSLPSGSSVTGGATGEDSMGAAEIPTGSTGMTGTERTGPEPTAL